MKKSKINLNKIGDIVYFKLNSQVLYQGHGDIGLTQIKWSGYIQGDGLSSQRLSCIHNRKIDEFSISNFLFRIESGKKYYHRIRLDEKLKQDMGNLANNSSFLQEVEQLRQKAFSEESDYENLEKMRQGLPVTYGSNLILRHIASNSYLTLNPSNLAK
jgi:Inositol 1,4,5-trisphosphate/ryanodine receptor